MIVAHFYDIESGRLDIPLPRAGGVTDLLTRRATQFRRGKVNDPCKWVLLVLAKEEQPRRHRSHADWKPIWPLWTTAPRKHA
ncbi:hypothetical protein BS329_19955 [Amycolatopsis coloradensis]|uniref:Uncharacterized protein n=1 Tax=Amycolatopsis coloradensis TaxID=76021 RepID=A0A1R0KS51_9PSEU|nr:hypothetical protein BS329_19955 [Amycolatopsis coloradensis]